MQLFLVGNGLLTSENLVDATALHPEARAETAEYETLHVIDRKFFALILLRIVVRIMWRMIMIVFS